MFRSHRSPLMVSCSQLRHTRLTAETHCIIESRGCYGRNRLIFRLRSDKLDDGFGTGAWWECLVAVAVTVGDCSRRDCQPANRLTAEPFRHFTTLTGDVQQNLGICLQTRGDSGWFKNTPSGTKPPHRATMDCFPTLWRRDVQDTVRVHAS